MTDPNFKVEVIDQQAGNIAPALRVVQVDLAVGVDLNTCPCESRASPSKNSLTLPFVRLSIAFISLV